MITVYTLALAKNVSVQQGSGRITLKDCGEFARPNGCAALIEALADDFSPVPLRARLLDSAKAEVWASDWVNASPSGPNWVFAWSIKWRDAVPPGVYNLVLESEGKRLASHVVVVP